MGKLIDNDNIIYLRLLSTDFAIYPLYYCGLTLLPLTAIRVGQSDKYIGYRQLAGTLLVVSFGVMFFGNFCHVFLLI